MQQREWLYYLLDNTGKSYRKENGLVVAKTTPKPLSYTPTGWEDISLVWERNLVKWGITRNYSLPMGFVLDGADILRYIFYNNNFDKQVYLLIQQQDLVISPTNYYFWYKFFYRGELDLTTTTDEENKVQVNIMEGGLSKELKANENTTYEIPVDELVVKMDGVVLKQGASFLLLNGLLDSDLNPHIPELSLLNAETVQSIGAKSTARTVAFNETAMFDSKEFFLFTSTETELTITWNFGITLALIGVGALPDPHYLFQLRAFDSDGNLVVDENLINYTADPLLFYAHHTFSGTATYTIPANSEVYLRSTNTIQGDFTSFTYDDTGTVDIMYTYLHRTTYIKANKPLTTYKRLIEKITGSQYNGVSDLLSTKPNLATTSGDAIRGFENSVIKSSMNDFFTSFNAVLNAGMGVENDQIRFEEKAHFFDDTTVIALGQVKNFKCKVANDFLYNTVKIGYPNQDYEDVNGREEFNTTQIRTSPLKRVQKELDLVSKYRADMYGIELTRINLDGKTTTDDSADNDTFILNIDFDNPQVLAEDTDGFPAGTTYYNLKRETYDSITGILSPSTSFNIEELTPKRLLKTHANFLNSIFYGYESEGLVFQTTDKNSELRTVKGADVFDEDGLHDIDSTPRLFKPFIFEFEPETPEDVVEQLQYNPNKCFSFIHHNGNTYKAYNLKVGIAPNSLKEQAFQLLCHQDNDLTTLA